MADIAPLPGQTAPVCAFPMFRDFTIDLPRFNECPSSVG